MEGVHSLNHQLDSGDAAHPYILEFKNHVDDISTQVDKLEKSVNEVQHFYSTTTPKTNVSSTSTLIKDKDRDKDKDKDKHFITNNNNTILPLPHPHQDASQTQSQRESAAPKRMQELMRQFATILRQISQHKWAWPFLEPVDVKGLGLHDYYEVIEKPMDLGTIKTRMEAKDGTAYNNVRDVYADVRLVFKNAMTYNDDKDDVHVMAKTLLEKFEERWLQLLPKVTDEEKRLEEEEAKAQLDVQLSQEAAYANMARDTSNKLHELDVQLRELKERVVQKCRRMSTEEKRKLGTALTQLSPEDISKALEIVAENNPSFQATAQEVDLDIDAQSEYTLWRLKVFVKEALKVQGNNGSNNVLVNNNNDDNKKNNSKRRREICDALAKSSVKRTKKLSNL